METRKEMKSCYSFFAKNTNISLKIMRCFWQDVQALVADCCTLNIESSDEETPRMMPESSSSSESD